MMSSRTTVAAPEQERATYQGRALWILGMLFASSVINYLDRQSLSILARTIQTALHLSDLDYARIIQFFLLPYTLAFLLAGRLTDWLKPKKAMAVFIVLWSAANLCTGFVRTGLQLGLARFVLGLGEPGNWVAAPKAITEIFTAKTRPIALCVTSAGATFGAALSPPLISFLAMHYGWRSAFFTTGALGMLWVIPWLAVYPNIRAKSVKAEMNEGAHRGEAARWISVLGCRELWLLTGLRMLTDPLWYFYLFWFPKYLSDSRHLTLRQLGRTAWVVYVAADLGSILAGLAVNRLVTSGRSSIRSEQIVMSVLACIAPVGALIPFTLHLRHTLLIAGVVAFAQLGWQMLAMALAFDYFSPAVVGTAWGIAMAGSGLGGLVSTNLIGHVVTSFSYAPVFWGLAAVHPLALVLLWSIRSSRAYTARNTTVQG
jgi:ACS family hexuronate transporter-like MFS transporter